MDAVVRLQPKTEPISRHHDREDHLSNQEFTTRVLPPQKLPLSIRKDLGETVERVVDPIFTDPHPSESFICPLPYREQAPNIIYRQLHPYNLPDPCIEGHYEKQMAIESTIG